jgi:hypothetical protein
MNGTYTTMKTLTLSLIGPPALDSPLSSTDTTKPLNEDDGFILLMQIVQLARAEKNYKHLLADLKLYAEKFPKVHAMIKGMGTLA